MSRMLTSQEYMNVFLNDNKTIEANNKLKTIHNSKTGFSRFSYTTELVEKILKDQITLEEMLLIEEANNTKRFIGDLILDLELEQKKNYEIDNFFNSFENKDNKERLFILLGETGVGKSFIVEKRFPTIPKWNCNKALDPFSLMYVLTDKGDGLRPHPTPFYDAIKNGGKVMLDEINELPHETLMFLQGITDEKKSIVFGDEDIIIHENFKIIGTMNPPSETDERIPLGDALISRSVGYVMILTDEIICQRLNCKIDWIRSIRKVYSYLYNCGFSDLRELSYRDFSKMKKYGFFQQLFYKVSMGDVKNISMFKKIEETQEFKNSMKEVSDNE